MPEMRLANNQQQLLQTSDGTFPLQEYRLRQGGREWTILHTGAVITEEDELHFFRELRGRLPYGVALWPAAIALAHEVLSRAEAMRGTRVLELGAGTGLPGIVAASLGAQVIQTDRHDLAMSICKRNGALNGIQTIEYHLADWTAWDDDGRYDWIIGSDILYGAALHPDLRQIFESNLKPQGRILLSDPFRGISLGLLEAMEENGWAISLSKWSVGEALAPRPIGLYELAPPQ